MTTVNFRRVNSGRLTRATVFGLLALAAVFAQSREARAQWATSGATTSTTNNVGVGTTAPSQMFHVHGPATWAGTRVTTAATGSTFNDGVNFGYDDAYGGYVWNREASPIVFSTSNLERMRLDAAGKLGIGTTAPAQALHVVGKGLVQNTGLASSFVMDRTDGKIASFGAGGVSSTVAYDDTGIFKIESNTRPNIMAGNFGAGGTPRLTIDGAGNVALGSATPNYSLVVGPSLPSGFVFATMTVSKGANASSSIVVGESGSSLAEVGWDNPNRRAFLNAAGSTPIAITQNGSNVRMFVTGTGDVGVGTTTPSSKFHVVGDITVTGNINAKYQDVAEWVPSKQRLAAGTVVILDRAEMNHVRASASAYDTGVAGVISEQPGLSLGEKGEGKLLVATTGRVRVKVDATRGAIKVSDLLVTSDVPGVAMKSQPLDLGGVPIHRPGTLIGKALEPLEKGVGEILVLLSLQ